MTDPLPPALVSEKWRDVLAADMGHVFTIGRADLAALVSEAPREELGLNVDMLDVDRLKLWANRLDEYGPNITEWGSVAFVVETMRDIAERLEREIRDIGELRKRAALSASRTPTTTTAEEK